MTKTIGGSTLVVKRRQALGVRSGSVCRRSRPAERRRRSSVADASGAGAAAAFAASSTAVSCGISADLLPELVGDLDRECSDLGRFDAAAGCLGDAPLAGDAPGPAREQHHALPEP